MDEKIYLIERTGESLEFRYYAEHGEVGGVQDAIGYDTAAHARKFRTKEEARDFIQTQLPEWGRGLHEVVGLGYADFLWEASALSALLLQGIEIPDKVLEPTAGRLRIWRS